MVHGRQIDSLQALRAIAAILVLLFHISDTLQTKWGHSFILSLFNFGFAGVDIFFVLSGFILYYVHVNKLGRDQIKSFFIKRCIRIYPIYWISLLGLWCSYFIGMYFFKINAANSGLGNVIHHSSLLSNIESWLLIPNDFLLNGISWTLSLEMGFYILFGALFFFKPRWFIFVLIIWVLMCYCSTYIFHMDRTNLTLNPWKAFLSPIITEFLFGCAIAIGVLYYPRCCAQWKWSLIIGIIWFGIAGYTMIQKPIYSEHFTNREFIFGLPSMLIVFGAVNIPCVISKIWVYLGDASYSIYLFHGLVYGMILKILIALKLTPFLNNFIVFIVMAIMVLAICCLIYHFIERPLLYYCKKKFHV